MEERFCVIPESVTRAMVEANASGREWAVLAALMHHKPNAAGEIGVSKGGYVMTSDDVAAYSNLSSAAAARTALKGLKDKGIVSLSRTVVKGGKRLNVYRLAIENSDETDTRIEIDTDSRIESDTHPVSDSIHTPISTQEVTQDLGLTKLIPTSKSYSLNAVSRNRSPTSVSTKGFRSNPIHPYPASPDEVYDFSESDPHIDGCLPYEDAERFFWKNQSQGWRYPDGSAIVDWHHALRRYSDGIIDNLTRKEARDEGVDRYAEYD